MSKIFLTSDLHFCHNREFLYKPRGYNTIEEHDACLVSIWNQTVSQEDTVYLLGDVMLNDNARGMYWLAQLNGNIKVLRGNHDSDTRIVLYQNLPNVEVIGYATMIRYRKYNIYLSHYPCRTSNYDDGVSLHRKVLSFCGHTHTSDRFADWDSIGAYHVEWDSHGRPVELDAAIKEIREKINGFYEPATLGLNYANEPVYLGLTPEAISGSYSVISYSPESYAIPNHCFDCVDNIDGHPCTRYNIDSKRCRGFKRYVD